jgi:hypothetical protein
MAKVKYSFWITVKKVAVFAFELLLAGALVWITDNPNWIWIAPVLEGIRNWLKTKYSK